PGRSNGWCCPRWWWPPQPLCERRSNSRGRSSRWGQAMDDTLPGRIVHALAKYTAIGGGTVLAVITVSTLVSVIGRGLIPIGLSPIPGDYEIVEAGVLFAVFAFLPWAQLTRGHAVVAIVTDQFSARINAIIVLIADLLMLSLAVFLALRHWAGMIDKQQYM